MSNWNDLSRERLIIEYKKYPCLWSNKDEDAKNVEKRKECLNLITLELNKHEERPFTQDEIRTQFKNLRDMYRRKRKRLHLQQEINPGVVIDEPGWVYFNRLKFLDETLTTITNHNNNNADFGPPNESPPNAPTPPLHPQQPPKKKGKISLNNGITLSSSSSRTPADDSSLPTPLEIDSTTPLEENNKSIIVAIKIEKSTSEEIIPSTSTGENKCELLRKEDVNETSNSAIVASTESPQKQNQQLALSDSRCSKQAYPTLQNHNSSSLDNLAEIAAVASFNNASTTTRTTNENHQIEQQQTKNCYTTTHNDDIINNTNNDEFNCFGRLIAITLRKIASRSAIDALEARKAIDDVIYQAELRSLQKQ